MSKPVYGDPENDVIASSALNAFIKVMTYGLLRNVTQKFLSDAIFRIDRLRAELERMWRVRQAQKLGGKRGADIANRKRGLQQTYFGKIR